LWQLDCWFGPVPLAVASPRWDLGGELKITPSSQTKKLTAKDAKDAKNGKNEAGKHNDDFIFAPFASFAVKNKPLF
jgi:hypothetical protein